jgi:hypothetical protein
MAVPFSSVPKAYQILGDVSRRINDLKPRIQANAEFLIKSGGLDSELAVEDAAAVLFVAALMDIGAQIESQLKKAPRLRKALNNLRHF